MSENSARSWRSGRICSQESLYLIARGGLGARQRDLRAKKPPGVHRGGRSDRERRYLKGRGRQDPTLPLKQRTRFCYL